MPARGRSSVRAAATSARQEDPDPRCRRYMAEAAGAGEPVSAGARPARTASIRNDSMSLTSSAVLFATRNKHRELAPWATAVLMGLGAFFTGLMLVVFGVAMRESVTMTSWMGSAANDLIDVVSAAQANSRRPFEWIIGVSPWVVTSVA